MNPTTMTNEPPPSFGLPLSWEGFSGHESSPKHVEHLTWLFLDSTGSA